MPAKKPQSRRQRLLDAIRQAGRITSLDLRIRTGILLRHQPTILTRDIESGEVAFEFAGGRAGRGGRPPRIWIWRGTRQAGAAAAGPDPRLAAKRTCLTCGKVFLSAHAGNRRCRACTYTTQANATPFDVPATIRYH